LRLAGDTEVSFDDGHPRVEHGRVFVRAWGDDERTLGVGSTITLGIGDAALEVERSADDTVHVIDVRGEDLVAQGPLLRDVSRRVKHSKAAATPTVQPASVWDDWTGGVASHRANCA